MNILCAIFGHKPPQYAWRKGWGGYEYLWARHAREDGIGRLHADVEGECARCEKTFVVGKIHVPRNAP